MSNLEFLQFEIRSQVFDVYTLMSSLNSSDIFWGQVFKSFTIIWCQVSSLSLYLKVKSQVFRCILMSSLQVFHNNLMSSLKSLPVIWCQILSLHSLKSGLKSVPIIGCQFSSLLLYLVKSQFFRRDLRSSLKFFSVFWGQVSIFCCDSRSSLKSLPVIGYQILSLCNLKSGLKSFALLQCQVSSLTLYLKVKSHVSCCILRSSLQVFQYNLMSSLKSF